ncbi:MAG TPA: hypothetical protein VMF57_05135 [Solirubrobacteraceae bacterium]|nr:hypothetical protein [Solirubrobacteraceae bacterium]
MAARRPARRRPRRAADRPVVDATRVDRVPTDDDDDAPRGDRGVGQWPGGLGWSCAVIFLIGMVLVGLGGWGLLRGAGRGSAAFGLGTSIVVGALLIVFAALLPWLADGPVRIGPLAVTLRIRSRPLSPGGSRPLPPGGSRRSAQRSSRRQARRR